MISIQSVGKQIEENFNISYDYNEDTKMATLSDFRRGACFSEVMIHRDEENYLAVSFHSLSSNDFCVDIIEEIENIETKIRIYEPYFYDFDNEQMYFGQEAEDFAAEIRKER